MSETYSVEAYLKATGVNKFTQDFKKATAGMKGIEESSAKASNSIRNFIGIAAGVAATVGVFRTLKGAVTQAFDRIDTMEQFDRVMTTMTGSSAKAKEVLDSVNDSVKGTAYGLDVAAKATQDFVTSNMDVDKATETIASWGDAVAFYGNGSNESFASVSDTLAKMTAKGKVQMDTMNRLTEAGIPAMQIYADATGKSAEEVAKQMSKGEVDAAHFVDTMNEALANGTENFEGIAGAAKEAGASWSGSFANMRAAVARGVTKIVSNIDEMLSSNGLPEMRDMVAKFGSSFENVLSSVADFIPVVVGSIQAFKDSLDKWKPTIDKIKEAFSPFVKTIQDSFMNLYSSMAPLWESLKQLFASLTPLLEAVGIVVAGVLVTAFATVSATISATVAAIGPLVEAFVWLLDMVVNVFYAIISLLTGDFSGALDFWKEATESAIEFIVGLWEGVITFFATFIQTIVDFFQGLYMTLVGNSIIPDMVNEIIEWFQNMFQWLIDIVMLIVDGVIDGFMFIYETVGNYIEMIAQIIESVLGFIKDTFLNTLDFLVGLVTLDFQAMKDAISSQMENIKNLIMNIWGSIDGFLSSTLGGIWNTIKSVFSNIFNTISDTLSSVRNIISNIWNGIKSTITNVVNGIRNTISTIFNGLGGIVSTAFVKVKTAVTSGITGAYDIVTGKVKDFFKAGSNIVGSIADGIKENVKKVTNAIGNVASKIRDFLPFSPAKEGALKDIMNIQIAESIAKSIDKGKRVATSAMGELSNALYGEMPEMNLGGQVSSINRQVHHRVDGFLEGRVAEKEPIILKNTILLDGRKVAESTYKYTDELMGRDKMLKERFGG